MAKDDRDILEILEFELKFVEDGGYGRSVRTPWRTKSMFEDSPTCLNFGDPNKSRPCEECLLMEFVPPEQRSETAPCHWIPLNRDGDTVHSLDLRGNPDTLEEAVKSWLRTNISRLKEARARAAAAQKMGWSEPFKVDGQRKRILVIDDDELVLITLEALLENQGYEVSTAWGGLEALRLLRQKTFNLILLDDYLPDVTSEEVLRQLRSMPARTPVVVMQSVGLTDDSAARFARLGACYFVSKREPCHIVALAESQLSQRTALAGCPQCE